MASLTGFGHFAGGLAQGIRGGSQMALSWAGLQQRQQQLEMQKQEQLRNESWKLMSMGFSMLDDKFPRATRMQGLNLIHKGASQLGGSASHLAEFSIELKPFGELAKKAKPIIESVSKGEMSVSNGMLQMHELVNDAEASLKDATFLEQAVKTAGAEAAEADKEVKRQIEDIRKGLRWEAGHELEARRTDEYLRRGKEQTEKLKKTKRGADIYKQQQAVIREIKAIETRNKVGGLNPLVLLGLHTKEERNDYLSKASKPVSEQLKGTERQRYMALTKRLGELTEQIAGSLEMEEMSQLYQSPEDVRNAYNAGEISSVEEAAGVLKQLFPDQYE